MAPHSQFENRARFHLCIHEQKRPTPERRRLSLTQDTLEKPISVGLVLTLVMKAWIADILLENSIFHFLLVHWVARMPISDRLSNNFRAVGTIGLDFSFSLLIFRDPYN